MVPLRSLNCVLLLMISMSVPGAGAILREQWESIQADQGHQWGAVLEIGYSGLARKATHPFSSIHTDQQHTIFSCVDVDIDKLNHLEATQEYDYLTLADPAEFLKALSELLRNGSCGTKRRKFVGSKVKILGEGQMDESYDLLRDSMTSTLPVLFIVSLATTETAEVASLLDFLTEFMRHGDFVLLSRCAGRCLVDVVGLMRHQEPLMESAVCPIYWSNADPAASASCLVFKKSFVV